MPESLSFDRAADFYDATREAPPAQIAATVEALTANFPANELVLEIGIGTGRIGVPFAATGRPLFGIDLSSRMLAKMRAKNSAIPVAQADATRLPFGDDTFGGAYAMWVLHLIEDWQEALCEAARVVRSGGTVLATIGGVKGFGTGPCRDISDDFRAVVGVERNLGATTLEEIDDFMAAQGWPGRDAATLEHTDTVAPIEMVRRLRDNIFSFTWPLDEDVRLAAVAQVEARAKERYGDLEVPLPNVFSTHWRAYDIT